MGHDKFRLNVDQTTNPAQILEMNILARMVDDRPHSSRGFIDPGVAPASILPADAQITASFVRASGADVLAEGPDYVLFLEAWTNCTVVTVAASTSVVAVALLEQILSQAKIGASSDQTEIVIWKSGTNGGGRRSDKTVTTPSWTEIKRNYPTRVRGQLSALMARQSVSAGEGRLILFHGDPGTGKTTAIRALMEEWSSWCEAHLVTDPDQLFADSSYLLGVLQSEEGRTAPTIDRPPGEAKWKLIIAEDADAYLRSSASHDTGAALGRLLNATDGLLGQSTKALILLSTNEELTRLHPALIRPGRCMTRLEFTRFSTEEAQQWMGDGGPVVLGTTTLAELFEARRTNTASHGTALKVGTYL